MASPEDGAGFKIQSLPISPALTQNEPRGTRRQRQRRSALLASQGANVTVAVIDSGLDLENSTLRDRLWRNPLEQPDGLDNDSNGRVDDLTGWDFVAGDPLPQDEHGHGTAMVDLILRHAPLARLMPLRVADAMGQAGAGAIAAAITAAVQQGARVINLSLSAQQSDPGVEAAIGNALQQGVMVIAAAGNEGGRKPLFPANVPGVIAAGSRRRNGRRPSWANGGEGKEQEFVAMVSSPTRSSAIGDRSSVMKGSSAAAAVLSGYAAAIIGGSGTSATAGQLRELARFDQASSKRKRTP